MSVSSPALPTGGIRFRGALRKTIQVCLRSFLTFPKHRESQKPVVVSWYKDRAFQQSSQLVRRLCAEQSAFGVTRTLLRNPRESFALVRFCRRARTITLKLDGLERRELHGIIKSNLFGYEPFAVLEIPDVVSDYLVGKARQALRTNIHHAVATGCKAISISTGPERIAINQEFHEILGENTQSLTSPIGESDKHYGIVGRSSDGRLLCIAAAKRFGHFAILEMFRKLDGTPEASMCRALVHAELVTALHADGVRFLGVDGALRLSPGLQYLQHLQGFEPVHLEVL